MKAQIGGHEEIVTILKEAGADTQQLEAVKVCRYSARMLIAIAA